MIVRSEYKAGPPRKDRPFTVVCYATVNTPYEAEAEVLKLSLESLDIPYEVAYVENLGSWQKNTQFKSHFISVMLKKYRRRTPILYLDVDSIVVSYPIALNRLLPDTDIAAVHFARGLELLSGTVWFNNSKGAVETVDKWQEINEMYPETLPDGREAWDQRTLELAIKQTKCKYVELPQNYTWIAELTQKKVPGLVPVILHTRGAKRYKNQINGVPGYAT